jgi:hypothetical protein
VQEHGRIQTKLHRVEIMHMSIQFPTFHSRPPASSGVQFAEGHSGQQSWYFCARRRSRSLKFLSERWVLMLAIWDRHFFSQLTW